MNSTRSRRAENVVGNQRPRIFSAPRAPRSSAQDVIDLAETAGLLLDDWQQFVLRHAMGEKHDGSWAASRVGLVVGRQNGKNSILEARELAGILLFGEQLIIHTAQEQETASVQHQRMVALLRENPNLWKRVARPVYGKGSEAIKFRSGQEIRFRTRHGSTGKGQTVDCLVFDEAYDLPDVAMAALLPTMAARSRGGNLQRWYTSSAADEGNPKHDGLVLARIREHGIAGEDGLAYFEWSVDWEDPDTLPEEMRADIHVWAQANPALGIRITPEWVEEERTGGEMSPHDWAVERLGVSNWPDPSGEAGVVVPREVWVALAEYNQRNRITGSQAFAIDTNVDQTWGSIAVGGVREDELEQGAVVRHSRGTEWIVSACAVLSGEHPGAPFAVDPKGPAANLIPDLRSEGVRLIEVTPQDYGDACADFVLSCTDGRFRYPSPQPDLDAALRDARKQQLGDRWKWSRRNSTSADISPLVAVTLARWAAMNAESEYTTVLFASDSQPQGEQPGPKIISQEEQTSCLACRLGSCSVHGDSG